MAYIRDSVIDQYGNAIANAKVDLLNLSGVLLATRNTDANGFFEFSVNPDSYKLQISGANLTTRLISPIVAVDNYQPATSSASGLMSATDKIKLDGLPADITISAAKDFTPQVPGDGALMTWMASTSKWTTVSRTGLPYALTSNFVDVGGTAAESGKYVKLDGLGRISYTFLNVTGVGGQSQFEGRIPVLDTTGRLDTSLFNASAIGGSGFINFLAKIGPGGYLDNTLINLASVGGASAANKIPKLNTSGRIDPSMLPTTGGTYRGSVNLTIAYAAPVGWIDGDFGSNSAAGNVHSSWLPYLNDPVPTTVKVGDSVYLTGGKYSVVPSSTDLAAYLPRDGSQSMTGPLTLTTQSSAALPTGDQAVSRVGAEVLYLRRQVGALPSVTQLTSKATAVSLNALQGKIVTHSSELLPAAMAGPRIVSFTLSNTIITTGSTIVIVHHSSGTLGAYRVWASAPVAGACTINLENISGASLSQAITLQFAVLVGT